MRTPNGATSTATIETLKEDFCNTDNGTCSTSAEFEDFLKRNVFKHVTPPYHPSSHGLSERAVQTFKVALQKTQGGSINTKVCRFLFNYSITPQTVTGISPADMLNKRKLRSCLNLLYPGVRSRVQQKQDNAVHKKPGVYRSFSNGDHVYVSNFGQGSKWIPGDVKQDSGLSVQVQLQEGRLVRRHLDHMVIRHDHA